MMRRRRSPQDRLHRAVLRRLHRGLGAVVANRIASPMRRPSSHAAARCVAPFCSPPVRPVPRSPPAPPTSRSAAGPVHRSDGDHGRGTEHAGTGPRCPRGGRARHHARSVAARRRHRRARGPPLEREPRGVHEREGVPGTRTTPCCSSSTRWRRSPVTRAGAGRTSASHRWCACSPRRPCSSRAASGPERRATSRTLRPGRRRSARIPSRPSCTPRSTPPSCARSPRPGVPVA